MRNELEVYLLSKMSASELVDAALGKLGLSREQMKISAASTDAEFALNEPAHLADAYEQLAGPAIAERPLRAAETGDVFAGSIRRYYSLSLWPHVQFVVNRDSNGYAWGEIFVQRSTTGRHLDLPDLIDRIHPWEAASDVVLTWATHVEILDEWTDFLVIRAAFHLGQGRDVVFRGQFDFGLLQSWQQEGQ